VKRRWTIPHFALSAALLLTARLCNAQPAAPRHGSCRIESVDFDGWRAQQLANQWVTLTIVPQLGGRLMQVTFGGHAYLFVNPRYAGKYFPPSEGAPKGRWFNYGGDKIWPLPEGTQDEQHWAGPLSDALDDGEYAFKILSQSSVCAVQLDGPADARTGLQYSRNISIDSDSPEISFHAVMKNATAHPIQWSMQSVSQYDTVDPHNSADFNHDFWAFTRADSHSSFAGGYRVRTGLASDPSFAVKDGWFTLHWMNLQGEVWIDSPGDWVVVVDGATHFAMAERFSYVKGAEYPGDASVIFYKNGRPPERKQKDGEPVSPADPDDSLFYMEAELNSPLVRLEPGLTYAMDTKWFPARAGNEFKTITDAGLVGEALQASITSTGVILSGSFGVFFPGTLVAHLYDDNGVEANAVSLAAVIPTESLSLNQTIKSPSAIARVSLHLVDPQGRDRGSLGEARVTRRDGTPR
jgi:hypothetical protein